MPPTRTRAATSAAVRPVRMATATRSGRASATPGEPAQRATGERHDGRGARIARALGERAVEVGDDEQAARAPGQRGDGAMAARSRSMPSTAGRAAARPRSRRDVDPRQDRLEAVPPSRRARCRRAPRHGRSRRCRSRSGPAARSRPSGRRPAVGVEPEREGRAEPLGERGDRALVLPDVDRDDDEAGRGVAGGEPVHQRELVLAWRTPGRHEVDPDRLAAQGREVDRAAADLRDGQGRRRLTDVERGVGRARRGDRRPSSARRRDAVVATTARRTRGRDRSGQASTAAAGRGRGRGAPRAAAPRRRPRPRGRRRSTGVPTYGRGAYQYRAADGVSAGPLLRCRVRWPPSSTGSARGSCPPASTALGVALLAGGLLSFTNPVTADPLRRRRRPSPLAVDRDPQPAHHAAADRLGAPAVAERLHPGRSGRDAGPHRGAQDRPRRSSASRTRAIRPATSRCTTRIRGSDSRARAARRTSTRTPERGCSCPLLTAVEGLERQQDARHGRRGLDERRPALPVRHHRGPAARPDRRARSSRRSRSRPSSSGCRPPRASGRAEAPGRRRVPVAGGRAARRGATRSAKPVTLLARRGAGRASCRSSGRSRWPPRRPPRAARSGTARAGSSAPTRPSARPTAARRGGAPGRRSWSRA